MIDMVVARYFVRLLTWRAIIMKDNNVNVTKEKNSKVCSKRDSNNVLINQFKF